MGRPRGSKSTRHDGYARRTRELKQKHGPDIFQRWGKLGGNPVLTKRKRADKSPRLSR